MAEYIEREALIAVICAEFCHVQPAPDRPCDGCYMVQEIAEAPAADVVEVGDCDGCEYSYRKRPQKCSCCRRNLDMKDCYRRKDDSK